MEELIEKYLDNFIKYHSYNDTRQYYNDEECKEREEGIKKELREIIKNNRNHMLRDSFICYMTEFGSFIIKELQSMYNDDKETLYKIIFEYFELGVFWPHSEKRKKYDYHKFVKIMEDDIKDACQKAYDGVGVLINDFSFQEGEFWFLRGCLVMTLCLCYINNEIDQFEAYLNVFLANTQLLLDDYEMNGFSIDDDDAVAERVYSLLKEKLNKSPTIQ